ncbi:MAG: hypothetical protein WDN75_02880 [Bacteroidota bacterium]
MHSIEEELSRQYWNNTLEDYLIAAGIIVAGLLLIRIFKRVILNRVGKWTKQSETQG